jgi:hypothetical protein
MPAHKWCKGGKNPDRTAKGYGMWCGIEPEYTVQNVTRGTVPVATRPQKNSYALEQTGFFTAFKQHDYLASVLIKCINSAPDIGLINTATSTTIKNLTSLPGSKDHILMTLENPNFPPVLFSPELCCALFTITVLSHSTRLVEQKKYLAGNFQVSSVMSITGKDKRNISVFNLFQPLFRLRTH